MATNENSAAAVTTNIEDSEPSAADIRGTPAARGHFVGRARLSAAGFAPAFVQAGDVLICQTPQPELFSLLTHASALVLDSGGALSIPATLARELGIPAVVAAADATSLIREGQRVAVDGDRGSVTVLSAGGNFTGSA